MEFVKESLTFTGAGSPMATLLLSVMGAFAEFERALILQRQREGIAAARQRGVCTGRKPALTAEQAQQLSERAAAGERKSALAREFRRQPRDRLQLPADPEHWIANGQHHCGFGVRWRRRAGNLLDNLACIRARSS